MKKDIVQSLDKEITNLAIDFINEIIQMCFLMITEDFKGIVTDDNISEFKGLMSNMILMNFITMGVPFEIIRDYDVSMDSIKNKPLLTKIEVDINILRQHYSKFVPNTNDLEKFNLEHLPPAELVN